MAIEFVWDRGKALANQRKHGVSFDEAKEVFFDDRALLISDLLHSIGEERFIIIGRSFRRKILVVVHLYLEEDEVVRIISSRFATRTESIQYLKGMV